MKIAICDDETEALRAFSASIKAAFRHLGADADVSSFSSVIALKEQSAQEPFDVYFLDIDMPEMDGIEFGASVRAADTEACIIFLSNREERVFDTFRVSPLRFLRKSNFPQEIGETARAVLAQKEAQEKRCLVVSSRGRILSFPTDDILYVECFNKVQNIVTRTQTVEVRATLKELNGQLLSRGFLCPHKGYLVNYKFIVSIDSNGIALQNGAVIPVSKYKITETKRLFMQLVAAEPVVYKPR